jgi:hypothetical protein
MANLPDRADPPNAAQLRAGDADRERVAALLRRAAAEGRLGLDELDQRLAAAYAARTYADLEPIVRDLPDAAAVDDAGTAAAAPGHAVAVMSGFRRGGRWVVPRTFTCVMVWGGGELDLRKARFAEGEVTIRAFAVMGGLTIIVPEDADVVVDGIGLMGGFGHPRAAAGGPGAPRVTVKGFALWGGVGVKRGKRGRGAEPR